MREPATRQPHARCSSEARIRWALAQALARRAFRASGGLAPRPLVAGSRVGRGPRCACANGASVGASCETALDWCMAAVCAHRLAATIRGGVRGQPRGAAGLPIRVGSAGARWVSAGRRGLAAGGAGMPATHDSDGATGPQHDQGEERPGSDAGVAPVHSASRGRGLRDLDDGHARGAEGAAPGGGVAGVGGAQVRRRLTYAGGVTGVGGAEILLLGGGRRCRERGEREADGR
jgi:hypothetical protein